MLTGQNAPPILLQYWLEKAFWKNLGLRRQDLKNRPKTETLQYQEIMLEEARKARADQNSNPNAISAEDYLRKQGA